MKKKKKEETKIRIYTDTEHWEKGKNGPVIFFQFITGINAQSLSIGKKIAFSTMKKESPVELLDTVDPSDRRAEYALSLGDFVKSHKGSAKKSKAGAIDKILIDDETLRAHMQVVGTTGSGKTVFLKSLLEQQIARGGGALAVFGKADNRMLQQIYTVAAKYGREQDLFVVDWTATQRRAEVARRRYKKKIITHSINLFDLGEKEDIVNSFLAIADINTESDEGGWGQAAKDLLQALLNLLIDLEAAGLSFDPAGLDDILQAESKFEGIKFHKEKLNFFHLQEYISNKLSILKLIAVVEALYSEDAEKMESLTAKVGRGVRVDRSRSERYRIHKQLFDIARQQTNKINLDNVIDSLVDGDISALEKIEEKAGGSQSPLYKLGISVGKMSAISAFFDKFGQVLKSRAADVDLIEAIESGRIVVMNLPGQDWEDAPKIARFVISMLQLIVKKRGGGKGFDLTYLLILDEINSWLRAEKPLGLGNILSVIRGLGIGAVVAYQSSLEGLDTGRGVELEQVTANVNTTIALKNNSPKVLEMLNKLVSKKLERREEETIENESRRGDKGEKRRVLAHEKDFFDEGTLTSLASGEGYIIRNGEAAPMVTDYRGEARYLEDEDEPVDLAKMISIEDLKRALSA